MRIPLSDRIPLRVQRWLWRAMELHRLTGDSRDLARLMRLLVAPPDLGAGRFVRIRLRALDGRAVSLRSKTTDAQVLLDAFIDRDHLPPGHGGRQSARQIWDLGANIGLTVADLAVTFPRARIVGVELDHGNATLARANVAPWGDRCEILHAAIWPHDGEVAYEGEAGEEWGFRVVEGEAGSADPGHAVPALSLNTLLARCDGGAIDYVKMDIEGAEAAVLRESVEWAAKVRRIGVAVHEPYTVEACRADLEALGFRTQVNPRHFASVFGERRQRFVPPTPGRADDEVRATARPGSAG